MTKRLVDLLLAVIALIVLVSVAVQAIAPYLPALGIGIVVVLIVGVGWFIYRLLSRRQFP